MPSSKAYGSGINTLKLKHTNIEKGSMMDHTSFTPVEVRARMVKHGVIFHYFYAKDANEVDECKCNLNKHVVILKKET